MKIQEMTWLMILIAGVIAGSASLLCGTRMDKDQNSLEVLEISLPEWENPPKEEVRPVDLRDVSEKDPFHPLRGQKEVESSAPAASVGAATAEPVKLVLSGIYRFGEKQGVTLTGVTAPNKVQTIPKFYQEGDMVAEGCQVETIGTDFVLLQHSGKQIRLELTRIGVLK